MTCCRKMRKAGSFALLVVLFFTQAVADERSPARAGAGGAQESAAREKEEAAPKPESTETTPRAELEKRFRDTLTNATLTGRWRLVDGGKLGRERDEKYIVSSATKISKDFWLIIARVQYAGKDVTVPVPVKVMWAGDTPVITVTDLNIPGLGTYTARVMVYRDLYTGTWFGPGHGGIMSGSIVKTKPGAIEKGTTKDTKGTKEKR